MTEECGYVISKRDGSGRTSLCARTKGHRGNHRDAEGISRHRESNRKWREANPEYRQEYYKKNTDRLKESNQRYRLENPEKIKEYSRRYQLQNADRIREYKREHYETKYREVMGRTPRGELRDPDSHVTIYGLYNDRDELIYIGQTCQTLTQRLKEHRAKLDYWRAEIAYIAPMIFTTWERSDLDEQFMLHLARNLHNKATYDPDQGFTREDLRKAKKLLEAL